MTEASVVLFPTCVVEAVRPAVGRAARRVLERLGYRVREARRATCCGQPAWNAGFAAEAARVAATTCDALARADGVVCVPSGSCTTMIRLYWPEMFRLAGDPGRADAAAALAGRVREFSEVVAGHRIAGRFDAAVAQHRSCHMTRELGIVAQPAAVLDALDGVRRVPWAEDLCCGFGGTFSIKQPEIAVAMADAKIDSLQGAAPDAVVGCDQSCLAHLEGRMRRRGIGVAVRHLAEVLDEAMEPG